MRLDYFSAKKYVKLECEGVGIGVQFHREGSIPGPHTDGRTLHVFEPNALWSEKEWEDWEYTVYHEIGHEAPENRDPHWKKMLKEKGISTNTLLGKLWNLMSDHVQEHNRIGKYIGRDKILKNGRARFVYDKLLPADFLEEEAGTKVGKIFKVASVYDTLRREAWNEYLSGTGDTAAEVLTGEEKEMCGKLYKSGIIIEDGVNENDAYEFAKAILAALGEDPEKHEKEAQEAKAAEEAGKGEKGEAGAEGKEGKTTGALGEKGKEEIKDMTHHTHYDKPKPTGDEYQITPSSDQHIEYPDGWGGSHTSFTPKPPVIVDIKAGEYNGMTVDPRRTKSFEKYIEDVEGGKILAGQVKRLLISMKQRLWTHGYKRGHISSKNLWKAKRPIYSDEVFKKRTSALELDTAVTILTDNSGSMSGQKFAHAAKAGLMLNEAMSKVGVPVELLSFSEINRGPLSIIVKGFNEYSVNEDVLRNRYAQCGSWMSQNSDGESIQWAHDRLVRRREKRKVLIVLSDGSPAAYNGGHGAEYAYTAQVVKAIEESKRVEIYGIGIMDKNVEKFYTDHKVLHDASELENMLLGLVKSKLLR